MAGGAATGASDKGRSATGGVAAGALLAVLVSLVGRDDTGGVGAGTRRLTSGRVVDSTRGAASATGWLARVAVGVAAAAGIASAVGTAELPARPSRAPTTASVSVTGLDAAGALAGVAISALGTDPALCRTAKYAPPAAAETQAAARTAAAKAFAFMSCS
jgi:hypothetical protein